MRLLRQISVVVVLLSSLFSVTAQAARKKPLLGTPVSRLLELAGKHNQVRLIVGVDDDGSWIPEGRLTAERVAQQRERSKGKKDAILRRHAGARRVPERDFETIPYYVLEVNANAIHSLIHDDGVHSIEEVLFFEPVLEETTARVGATALQQNPPRLRGGGQMIAVLDTGVDSTHPFLRWRVDLTDEACFSTNTVDTINTYTSLCSALTPEKPNGTAEPCTVHPNCGHGTHTAGVAAGHGTWIPAIEANGMAPSAGILPIKIATLRTETTDSGPPTIHIGALQVDLLSGLLHVERLAPKYQRPGGRNRLAVNLSWSVPLPGITEAGKAGLTASRAVCRATLPSIADVIASLTSRDIPVIAGTGNDQMRTVIAAPACMPNAIAVSASINDGTAETLPWYANTAAIVDLLAPGGVDGQLVKTSEAGGGFTSTFGTSIATPHVTGAIALLREADRTATWQQLRDRLFVTGKEVADTRVSGTVRTPRIQVAEAFAACDYRLMGAVSAAAAPATTEPGDTVSARVYRRPRNEQTYLTVALNAGSAPADHNYVWSAPNLTPVSTDATGRVRVFRAPAVTADQTYTITVTATKSRTVGTNTASYTCTRTIQFRLVPSDAPSVTLLAGQCTQWFTPGVLATIHTKFLLRTALRDADGQLISDVSGVYYEWKSGSTVVSAGTGPDFATYTHLVTSATEPALSVSARMPNGAVDSRQITLRRPIPGNRPSQCTLATPCTAFCRNLPIRLQNLPVSSYTFVPGELLTLRVPEEVSGAVYEWRRLLESGYDEKIGDGAQISFNAQIPGRYYVITILAAEEYLSSYLTLTDAYGSSDRVTISPLSQTVVPGGTATIQVSFQPDSGATATYEWREGDVYDTTAPVIATGPTLLISPVTQSRLYWCRVVHRKADGSIELLQGRLASVTADCVPNVSGAIVVSPSHGKVARNQQPQLVASTGGMLQSVEWTKRAPGGTKQPAGSNWSVINAGVTLPVTLFGATITDTCGTTGELAEVGIFLCVPTIDQQPQSTIVKPGTNPTFSVAARPAIDNTPFSVSWYRSSDTAQTTPLGSGTSFTPTLPSGTTTESYYASVTASCGGSSWSTTPAVVKSSSAIVEVCANPAIVTYTPVKPTEGGPATLSVTATGKQLTYQWYLGASGVKTTPLSGSTSATLNVSPNTTTSYWCLIKSQGVCETPTPTMTVKVCAKPVLAPLPASTPVFSNRTATFTASATGGTTADPLTYQWYLLNVSGAWSAIPGATGVSYTTPAMTADATYAVEVSTSICKTFSNSASVTVCSYNEEYPGSDRQIAYNGTATLSLPTISPVLTKNITWYRGAAGVKTSPVATGSGTNLSYNTPQLKATTQYWAEFEAQGCTSRTAAYTVSVCQPTITTHPASITIASGSTTLAVGTEPVSGLTYQWYVGAAGTTSNPAPNGTGPTLPVTPAATTTYWVRVTGCGTSVNSNAATVTVCAPPDVTTTSQSLVDTYGGQGYVEVTATGTELRYQWYRGTSGNTSSIIAGATAARYNFIQTATETYWCRVSSACRSEYEDSPSIKHTVDPRITTHPQSTEIPAGSSANLSVVAEGTELTYQWYQGTAPGGVAQTGPTATTANFMTPVLAVDTNYWCKVTSGGASVASSNTATVTICTGPYVSSLGVTSVGTNSWRLTVFVAAEDQERGVRYHWYSGTRGNPAQSIDLGVGSNYKTFYNVPQTTTYWVRVWYDDNSCYTDSPSRTLTPQ